MTDASVTEKAADDASTATSAAAEPTAAPQRSLDEIEAALDVTRTRLAGRLDDLATYISPKNVAQRQMDKVKGVFVDEYGGVRPDRVLMATGVVVAIIGLRVLRRRRRG